MASITNWIRSLAFLAALAVIGISASAEEQDWKTNNDAGKKAFDAGHYAEAEKLQLAALKVAEESGVEDAHLATSLNELAVLYEALGKYDLAEPLYQRSLAIRVKTVGPNHPGVAQSLNNLALLYTAQGKYDLAEPLYQQSLATWEKALGPDHPDVALSLENYALMLKRAKLDAEAEPMLVRAKAIRDKNQK